MKWRWLHRMYAWLFGYFWIACPLCGGEFGGHEWEPGDAHSIPKGGDPTHRTAICPPCGADRG